MKDFVDSHRVLSKEVAPVDMPRVRRDAARMRELISKYENCIAIAHPQIENERPLRFYVDRERGLIINPIIISRGRELIDSTEGCMTYPDREHTYRKRHRIVTVQYQPLGPIGELLPVKTITLKGFPAIVAQHEIDHLDAIYCYDDSVLA